MSDKDQLKPCPFCGAETLLKDDGYEGYGCFPYYTFSEHDTVSCPIANISIGNTFLCYETRESAINAWNTRATPSGMVDKQEIAIRDNYINELQSEVEALKDEKDDLVIALNVVTKSKAELKAKLEAQPAPLDLKAVIEAKLKLKVISWFRGKADGARDNQDIKALEDVQLLNDLFQDEFGYEDDLFQSLPLSEGESE